MIVLSVSTTNMLLITFILESFYLSSQNALTVYLQLINGHWPFITFRPHLLDQNQLGPLGGN
jgi:hypothetical protein